MKTVFHNDYVFIDNAEYRIEVLPLITSGGDEYRKKELVEAWDRNEALAAINKDPTSRWGAFHASAVTLSEGDLIALPELQVIYRVKRTRYGAYEIVPTQEDYALLNKKVNLFTR